MTFLKRPFTIQPLLNLLLILLLLLQCCNALMIITTMELNCTLKHHISGWEFATITRGSNTYISSIRLTCTNGTSLTINGMNGGNSFTSCAGQTSSFAYGITAAFTISSISSSPINNITNVDKVCSSSSSTTRFGGTPNTLNTISCPLANTSIADVKVSYYSLPGDVLILASPISFSCRQNQGPLAATQPPIPISLNATFPATSDQSASGLALNPAAFFTVSPVRDEVPILTFSLIAGAKDYFCFRYFDASVGIYRCAQEGITSVDYNSLKSGAVMMVPLPKNILGDMGIGYLGSNFNWTFQLTVSSIYSPLTNLTLALSVNVSANSAPLRPVLGAQASPLRTLQCPNPNTFVTRIQGSLAPSYNNHFAAFSIFCSDNTGPQNYSTGATGGTLNWQDLANCPVSLPVFWLNSNFGRGGMEFGAPIALSAVCANSLYAAGPPVGNNYDPNNNGMNDAVSHVCDPGSLATGLYLFGPSPIKTIDGTSLICTPIPFNVTFASTLPPVIFINGAGGISSGSVLAFSLSSLNVTIGFGTESVTRITSFSLFNSLDPIANPSTLTLNSDYVIEKNTGSAWSALSALPANVVDAEAGLLRVRITNTNLLLSSPLTIFSIRLTVTSFYGHFSIMNSNISFCNSSCSSISSSTSSSSSTSIIKSTISSTVITSSISTISSVTSSIVTSSTTSSVPSTSVTATLTTSTASTPSTPTITLTSTSTINTLSPTSLTTTASTPSTILTTTASTTTSTPDTFNSNTTDNAGQAVTSTDTLSSIYLTTTTTTTTTSMTTIFSNAGSGIQDATKSTLVITSTSVAAAIFISIVGFIGYRRARGKHEKMELKQIGNPKSLGVNREIINSSQAHLFTNSTKLVPSSIATPPQQPGSSVSTVPLGAPYSRVNGSLNGPSSSMEHSNTGSVKPAESFTFRLTGQTMNALSIPGYLKLDPDHDFTLGPKIGRGGTAFVYKATLTNPLLISKHGTDVAAVKLMNQVDESGSFYFEVALLGSIKPHPNIIAFFGYFSSPEKQGMVTKLYNFCLRDFLYNPEVKLNTHQKLLFIRQIAQACNHLHSQHIVHFDIKPLNVLGEMVSLEDVGTIDGYSEGINLVLNDFGSAKPIGSEISGKIVAGLNAPDNVALTIAYSSPELLDAFAESKIQCKEVHKKIDVYAFAITSFEIICQEQAWHREPEVPPSSSPQSSSPQSASPPIPSPLIRGDNAKAPRKTNARDLIGKIRMGMRPIFPPEIENVSEADDVVLNKLVKVVKKCWDRVPEKRPSFERLVKHLDVLLDPHHREQE